MINAKVNRETPSMVTSLAFYPASQPPPTSPLLYSRRAWQDQFCKKSATRRSRPAGSVEIPIGERSGRFGKRGSGVRQRLRGAPGLLGTKRSLPPRTERRVGASADAEEGPAGPARGARQGLASP